MTTQQKTTLLWIVGIVIVAGLVWWGEEKRPTANPSEVKEPIKIGAILPLSGTTSFIGQDMQEGANLAVEKINDENGTERKHLQIVYEDSKGEADTAVSAYNKLRAEGINLFLTTQSHVTLALAPLAEENQTPMFTIAVAPSILNAGEYTFVNNFNGEQELAIFTNFIRSELGDGALAILAENVEFGTQYKNVLEQKWIESGNTIVTREVFESSATDYRTQLTKIKALNPKYVYIVGFNPHIIRILNQARELGLQQQFLSYWGAQENALLEKAGKSAEGLIFPSSPFGKDTNPEFFADYQSHFNRDPHYRAGLAYDIVNITAQAVEQCGMHTLDPVCVKDRLYQVRDFAGITGPTTIDSDGGTTKDIIIWKVVNKQFVPYDPAN